MKKVLYTVYLFVIAFVFTEIIMRSMDFKPAVFQNFDGFTLVDSLYEYKNYTTDEFGAYTFSSWASDSIPKYFNPPEYFPLNDPFKQYVENEMLVQLIDWETDHISAIFRDYSNLWLKLTKEGTNENKTHDSIRYSTPFPKKVQQILHSDMETRTPLDALILDYAKNPFNSNGFRSIEFVRFENDRPRILLVGDSFVFGESADPFYNSFPDLLLARGYGVYNAGISGTDPAQYLAIVKKYLSKLEPDIVIINFCLHNDFMGFIRDPHPDRPHEYITNAGFFYSNPKGIHRTVEEAYVYYKRLSLIPDTDKNIFNNLCSKTALTTQLWGVMYEMNILKHPYRERYFASFSETSKYIVPNTRRYIDSIYNLARIHVVPLAFALIPDITRQTEESLNGNFIINFPQTDTLFESYITYFPDHFVRSDFAEGYDIHFNNTGSVKFADYLEEIILQKTSAFDQKKK